MYKRLMVKGVSFLLPSLLIVPSTASAAISNSPLFVDTAVQPNIFFMVDDSRSMTFDVILSNEGKLLHPDIDLGNTDYYTASHPRPRNRVDILKACSGYNKLYFNPSVTYLPWVGSDINGDLFVDQTITSARIDPYETATVDLTDTDGPLDWERGYSPWSDDGDGVYELGECPDPESEYDYNTDFVPVSDMSVTEKNNFANWYTYYRTREHVMKSALLPLIDGASARLGIATLWNNGGDGVPIADITSGSHREDLKEAVLNIESDNFTPLRAKLEQVGEYFKGTTSTDLFGSVQPSPILDEASGGSCQQNFTLLMSDGHWNGWMPSVGDADSDDNSSFDGGEYADDVTITSPDDIYVIAEPVTSTMYPRTQNTLADVAMHYYEGDLNTTLSNNVPSPEGGNDQQHMVTYTVAFGVNGTLTDTPPTVGGTKAWPTVEGFESTTIDDMRHAAWNGRGEFLSADSPSSLTTALNNAVASISNRTSSASSVATNSTRLQTDSKIYQARFTTTEWNGDIWAYNIDSASGAVSTIAWKAADVLPAEPNRNIYTSIGVADSGVAFEWASASGALSTAGLDENKTNYLRGDQSNEGAQYRLRTSVFGDVVNSDPIYSGRDNYDYYTLETTGGGNATYDDYLSGSAATAKGTRKGMIYVGANDGMLHGLLGEGIVSSPCDPDSQDCEGEEIFAYIPKAVHSRLSSLTSSNYNHQYFVDNTAAQGDAYINFDGAASDSTGRWGTALVGTLGAGGKGLFALDISDPLNFTASDVLWDIDSSDTGFSDIGYTFAKAAIVKLHDDNSTNNNDWGVIVGNGYESVNGKAVLYIIGLRTGELIWKQEVDTSGGNGLSTPLAIDTNNDDIADRVYAGDLKGNMWAFDISGDDVADWEIAKSHRDRGTTYSDPLFTACTADPCTGSNYQPITSKAQAISAGNGKILVLFGTGKYFEVGDNTETSQTQTFYSVLDDGSTSQVSGRDALLAQTITHEFTALETGLDFNTRLTTNYDIDFNSDDGWYLDLYFDGNTDSVNDHPGERIVADPLVRNGRVIFPTLIPKVSPCSFGGTSYLMEIDAKSGSRLEISPFDLNGDGVIDENDWVEIEVIDENGNTITIKVPVSGKESTVGIIKTPGVISTGENELKYTSGSSGDVEVILESAGEKLGRQSWMQIK